MQRKNFLACEKNKFDFEIKAVLTFPKKNKFYIKKIVVLMV